MFLRKCCDTIYEEVNGEKCYVIHTHTDLYFNMKNGTIFKWKMINSTIDYKDYKFNSVTDEDIKKPELTEQTES